MIATLYDLEYKFGFSLNGPGRLFYFNQIKTLQRISQIRDLSKSPFLLICLFLNS